MNAGLMWRDVVQSKRLRSRRWGFEPWPVLRRRSVELFDGAIPFPWPPPEVWGRGSNPVGAVRLIAVQRSNVPSGFGKHFTRRRGALQVPVQPIGVVTQRCDLRAIADSP